MIAAPSSGTGKTTVTIGLMAAFRQRGLKVQPYKVGPDYIDPAFHAAVTGRESINLDGWLLKQKVIQDLTAQYSVDADLSIIEGVMGLYDGRGLDPLEGSTAGLSIDLKTPVILVLDAKGMSASIAAVVHGLKTFRPVQIAGVIINRPSSDKYYQLLKACIETHTHTPVLGFVPVLPEVQFPSRHLGLIQQCEIDDWEQKIKLLGETIGRCVDLETLIQVSKETEPLEKPIAEKTPPHKQVTIAVAQDQAFQFYYPENLHILQRLGAELVFFSPLQDRMLPGNCDALYIGGGYPEVFAQQLENNETMRRDIRVQAEKGLPIYGECGGYMFLHERFKTLENKTYEMCGVFKGEAVMTKRLQHFGYNTITACTSSCLFQPGDEIRAHEFHRSVINNDNEEPVVKVSKTYNGKKETWECGKVYKQTFGMYPHLYFAGNEKAAAHFIQAAIAYKTHSK